MRSGSPIQFPADGEESHTKAKETDAIDRPYGKPRKAKMRGKALEETGEEQGSKSDEPTMQGDAMGSALPAKVERARPETSGTLEDGSAAFVGDRSKSAAKEKKGKSNGGIGNGVSLSKRNNTEGPGKKHEKFKPPLHSSPSSRTSRMKVRNDGRAEQEKAKAKKRPADETLSIEYRPPQNRKRPVDLVSENFGTESGRLSKKFKAPARTTKKITEDIDWEKVPSSDMHDMPHPSSPTSFKVASKKATMKSAKGQVKVRSDTKVSHVAIRIYDITHIYAFSRTRIMGRICPRRPANGYPWERKIRIL